MKVCATVVYGPFNQGHARFDSIADAVSFFRTDVADVDYGTGTEEQCMDLYPACPDCTDEMTFHDYPMARYVIGKRRGVTRVRI